MVDYRIRKRKYMEKKNEITDYHVMNHENQTFYGA